MNTYEQLQKVCTTLLNREQEGSGGATDGPESDTIRPMIEELKTFIHDISRRQNVRFITNVQIKR